MKSNKPLFKPLKSKRTFEEISSKIKDLVFEGALKPGDRLPSETELSKQFDVGRQTIREALRLLERSGFITIQKGGRGGPVIKDTILNRIGELFLDAFRMKKISLSELTRARLAIEKVVLQNVFEHAGPEHIDALKDNVLRAEANIGKQLPATKENFEFHTLLAEASRNHVFVIVMESIMAVHADLLSRIGSDVETSRRVVSDHRKIVEAIEDRHAERAMEIFEDHVLEVRDRLHTAEGSETESSG